MPPGCRASRSPRTSPTSCSSGSTGSTTHARQVVRVASVAGRKVAHDLLAVTVGLDSRQPRGGAAQGGRDERARRRRRPLLLPARAARRGRLRRPAARRAGPAARRSTPRRWPTAARRGPPPSWPGTPGSPTTSTPRSSPRSAPATRRWRSAAPTRPRSTTSRRSSCWPTRPAASATAATSRSWPWPPPSAVTNAGQPTRAAKLLAEQLAMLPADATRPPRARMLAARADALFVTEPDEDPLLISQQAVDLLPEDAGGLRAKVLAVHARILSGYGKYDEAQSVGLDALALAERLDLHELASDVITTLSGLKKAGPKEALRSALTEAVERAPQHGRDPRRDPGALLPGSLLPGLGGVRRGRALVPQRDGHRRRGRPPLGAVRLRGPLAAVVGPLRRRRLGRGRCELTDVTGEHAPPMPAALLAERPADGARRTRRAGGRAGPGAATFWEQEGGVAIHSAVAELTEAARSEDPHTVVDVYRDVVARARPHLARVVQRADPAGGDDRRRHRGPDAAAQRGRARRPTSRRSSGCTARDTRCCEKYADPSGHWGPEGRAWMKRLDAETLRARWLAGIDAPPQDALVDAWREAEQLFADLRARPRARRRPDRARRHPARDRRRRPVPARSVTWRERSPAALGAQPLLDELRAVGLRAEPRGRRLGHPDRARGRDPRPRRRGPLQRRDRQAAVHQRQDRLGARVQHPGQARCLRPDRGRRHRPPPRPARLTPSTDSLDRPLGVSRRVRHDREGYLRARTHQRPGGTT